jgi:hypothetical protein
MYMQLSRLKASCRHSSLACERFYVDKFPNSHSNYIFLTAGFVLKQQIKKVICLLEFH